MSVDNSQFSEVRSATEPAKAPNDKNIIKLQIFDPASTSKDDSSGRDNNAIIQAHYRNCHGVIICFDLSDRNSFLALEKWIYQAKEVVSEQCTFLLVGTKSDLPPLPETLED